MRAGQVTIILAVLLLGVSEAALAYVGPGAGLSLLGALWGLVAAVGAALLFIVLWPLRRARRRRAQARQNTGGTAAEATAADNPPEMESASAPAEPARQEARH